MCYAKSTHSIKTSNALVHAMGLDHQRINTLSRATDEGLCHHTGLLPWPQEAGIANGLRDHSAAQPQMVLKASQMQITHGNHPSLQIWHIHLP